MRFESDCTAGSLYSTILTLKLVLHRCATKILIVKQLIRLKSRVDRSRLLSSGTTQTIVHESGRPLKLLY